VTRALRLGALALIASLLVNPPLGQVRPVAPLVALDVSLSWMRATDSSAWARARDEAMRTDGDSVLLVGSTLRTAPPPPIPTDTVTNLTGAIERARVAGRPLVFFTDAEVDTLRFDLDVRLPAGSRIVAHLPQRGPDLAITGLDAPAGAIEGDSVSVGVFLKGHRTPPRFVSLVATVDGRELARRQLDPFESWGERLERIRVVLPPGPREAHLVVHIIAENDAEPRNDTASRTLRRGERITALAVSTAPDFDFREIARVLRGALSVPTVVRSRVAPGRWVDDHGNQLPEARVRQELARAQVVLLHGDTAYFGEPRTAVAGGLALVPPPQEDSEWFLTAAPPSPLRHFLMDLPFDSLPPVALGRIGRGQPLLHVRGPGGAESLLGSIDDSVRRVIVMPVRGTYRWALRGGAAADAFATIWGAVFAALAERPGAEFAGAHVRLPPRELHPRMPTLQSGQVGSGVSQGTMLRPRDVAALWILLIALLAAEWILRRRSGLR
jgi:hypothetical protein